MNSYPVSPRVPDEQHSRLIKRGPEAWYRQPPALRHVPVSRALLNTFLRGLLAGIGITVGLFALAVLLLWAGVL